MTDESPQPEETGRGPDTRDALRVGLRRAALHLVRAGYEVVAGVGAIVDELVKARRPDDDGDRGPARVEVE